MTPFTHPAKKIDQVDSMNKDIRYGVVLPPSRLLIPTQV